MLQLLVLTAEWGDMLEKRESIRHKKQLPITFGFIETNRMGYSADISDTGMLINTPKVAPPNTKIIIEFNTEDNLKIKIVALVVWAKNIHNNLLHSAKLFGMGVKFLYFYSGEEHFNRFLLQN